MLKKCLFIVLLATNFCLIGCSTLQEKFRGITFDNVIIRNKSYQDIKDVKIRVEKFNRVFFCGLILSKSMCSNGFKPKEYQGNAIIVSWSGKNSKYSIGPIVVKQPEKFDVHKNYSVIIGIGSEGKFAAFFE